MRGACHSDELFSVGLGNWSVHHEASYGLPIAFAFISAHPMHLWDRTQPLEQSVKESCHEKEGRRGIISCLGY